MFHKIMSVLIYRQQRKQTKNSNYFVKEHKKSKRPRMTGSFSERHPFLIIVFLIIAVTVVSMIFK